MGSSARSLLVHVYITGSPGLSFRAEADFPYIVRISGILICDTGRR